MTERDDATPVYDVDEPSAWFWDVIASADGDVARMREILTTELTLPELRRFTYELETAVADVVYDPVFAPYLTQESEDGALDVGYWAVGQGRTYYEGLFEHPETIPEHVERHAQGVLYDGISVTVYFERTGEEMPDPDPAPTDEPESTA